MTYFILVLKAVQGFTILPCHETTKIFDSREALSSYIELRNSEEFVSDGYTLEGAMAFEAKRLALKVHTKKVEREVFDKITLE